MRDWRPRMQTYLVLMNLILLCLLFPLASFVFLHEITTLRDTQLTRTMTQMRQDLERRGVSLSRSMAMNMEQAIVGYDFTFINSMMQRVVSDDREILYCMAMNAEGDVLAHSESDKVGIKAETPLDLQVGRLFQQDFPQSRPAKGVIVAARIVEGQAFSRNQLGTVMEAVVPLYNGERLWAVLRCGFSLSALEAEKTETKKEWAGQRGRVKLFLVTISGGFFFVGVLVAALFTRFFVRSTLTLSDGVRRIAGGNLKLVLVEEAMFCAEFVRLAVAINTMTGQLQRSYQELDDYNRSLEQKVLDRTQELKEAQGELVQKAHEAGMAEMAVGILHNIGNAITPAKVGAGLCLRRLQESPLRNNLSKAMGQVRDLIEAPTRVPETEKRRLLEIIGLLATGIRSEFDGAIREIELIRNKHEHIEGIIGLQMRYARLFGDNEEVDLNEVTLDALKMLGDSLRGRAVRVEEDFAQLPPVKIEKAKLLQVIINLIKNGYEAMDELVSGERCLRIATRAESDDPPRVMLSIKDNGGGIDPAEAEKIFKFGYTTKKTGSGFGLHSCAIYLMANHGSITAHSAGPGQGAEFVVTLPVDDGRTAVETGV